MLGTMGAPCPGTVVRRLMNRFMSSAWVIVCRSCGSYQTECLASPEPHTRHYHCACCGDEFDVSDAAAYVKQHPANIRRCSKCDREGVELVEQHHRYPQQPKGEVVDLYRCSLCGQEMRVLVQRSPQVLYD
jgi:DNA-directed RNA polymerase subunit RPC12/RpoP